MYSIVGSNTLIWLIFSSSSSEARARFWAYNFRKHSITKKYIKIASRFIP